MNLLKEILIKLKMESAARWWMNLFLLVTNYIQDGINYYKFSNVFNQKSFSKIESNMIMAYHSIEKGFLYKEIKPKFAKNRVETIIKALIMLKEISGSNENSQIIAAKNVLCKYYEYHLSKQINIEDYFPEKIYREYKTGYIEGFRPVHYIDKLNFYKNSNKNFSEFSNSRKSLRDFNGEIIDQKKIEAVIKLANNAPSVCNRQSCKVYLLNEKKLIDNVLKIQGGFTGYENNVKQLLILVSNKNYFYTIGERNQMYIDGGIYLMNLLYSLHFYHIAACPANWGKCVSDDKLIRKYIGIPNEEQVICLIPIGYPKDEISYANSERRNVDETLTVYLGR